MQDIHFERPLPPKKYILQQDKSVFVALITYLLIYLLTYLLHGAESFLRS